MAWYRDVLDAADREHKAAGETVARIDDELASIDRKVAALSMDADIATEADVRAARQIRDHGWTLVRDLYVERRSGLEGAARRYAPDGRMAETYELAVAAADRSVDTLRAMWRKRPNCRYCGCKGPTWRPKKPTPQRQQALAPPRANLMAEWRGLWPAGFVSVQLPGEMLEWATRREAAIAAGDDLEAERDALMEASDKANEAQRVLAAALEARVSGPPGRDWTPCVSGHEP